MSIQHCPICGPIPTGKHWHQDCPLPGIVGAGIDVAAHHERIAKRFPNSLSKLHQAELAEQTVTSDGGSSAYYEIPDHVRECIDLIEHLNLGFGLGNAFKAFFRLGRKAGTSRAYDLRKIIFFAQRELEKLEEGA